jgi:hypothetical protein
MAQLFLSLTLLLVSVLNHTEQPLISADSQPDSSLSATVFVSAEQQSDGDQPEHVSSQPYTFYALPQCLSLGPRCCPAVAGKAHGTPAIRAPPLLG